MQVDIIEDFESFKRLRANWDAVYAADPGAELFLSWTWLSGWLPQLQGPWFILAVKPDAEPASPYVAFLPLRLRTTMKRNGTFHNELNMAGNYVADYTGLICDPETEHRAIPALARHLKQLHWSHAHLDNLMMSDARMKLLLAHFNPKQFEMKDTPRINKRDNVNNSICPRAELPADWDGYLSGLGSNTRQKIRRLLRMIDGSDEYRITHSTADTVQQDIETLLKFWEIKWRPRKGHLVDGLVRSNRSMLMSSFERGLLFLPTLWKGDRPLAALATLIDEQKRSFLFYITGRDETFDGPPPGMILHAHSIRHAIENGFTAYDFLRGNEPYKYLFGCTERLIHCVTITTRNGLNIGNRLDPRCIPAVLERVTKLHQAKKVAEAERGYRQILDANPKEPDALHRYGQLLLARKDYAGAKRLFKVLVTVRPDTFKSWYYLAQACEVQGQFSEAADAYQKAIENRPDLADLRSKCDRALIKAGRMTEPNDSHALRAPLAVKPAHRALSDDPLACLNIIGQKTPSRSAVGPKGLSASFRSTSVAIRQISDNGSS